MANRDLYPLYSKPGIDTDRGWVFYDDAGEIEIESESDEISEILSYANGRNSVESIKTELAAKGYDPERVLRIIDDLNQLGVVVDKSAALLSRHGYSDNPTFFAHPLPQAEVAELTANDPFVPRAGIRTEVSALETVIGRLGYERSSCRNFGNESLGIDELGTILNAAYSADRPVPSAGALYPLRLYAIINRSDEIPSGYYQYDHKGSSLVQFSDEPEPEKLKYIFNSDSLVHNAPVVIVIAADLSRQTEKYSNRGYRYTILEAGHTAQNINLAATELGLGTLEYGGFQDNKLAGELGLGESEKVLVCIALGHKTETKPRNSTSLAELEKIVGPDKPVKAYWIDLDSKGVKHLDFFHATSYYCPRGSNEENLTSGASRSMETASIKAIAEAYERYIASCVYWDVESSAENLPDEWLHPTSVMPLTKEQLATRPHLVRFNESQVLQWIKSHDRSGKEVLVPIDLVFYPIQVNELGRKLIADVSSSGMAAHPDREVAVRKGLLELIERDAVMRCWFKKQTPDQISPKVLSRHIRDRVNYWRDQGRQLYFLDMSNRGVPVCMTIMVSEGIYPFFLAGASADDKSFIDAAEKAVQEIETLYLGAQYDIDKPEIKPEEVRDPADHGRIYYNDEFRSEIEWLWQGDKIEKLPEADKIDLTFSGQ